MSNLIQQSKLIFRRMSLFDTRVIVSLAYRGSQSLVGVISILFITQFFTKAEQGYYYTFNSLLALQIIFEMGLSFIILQYAGHEFAVISWVKGKITGEAGAIGRFQAFLARAIVAYAIIAGCIFFLVWPAGLIFFARAATQPDIIWQGPWVLLCVLTALNITTLPFWATIEGSGLVVKANRFRTIQNAMGACGMWFAMMSGAELYSIAISPLICFALSVFWLHRHYKDLLTKAYTGFINFIKKRENAHTFSWMREVWPMQWRIAISWVSGYFLSQIYTPIIFYYQDAASAGRFGASMAVCNMLSLVSITIVSAYNPQLCKLIAGKKWEELFALFEKVFISALVIAVLMAVVIISVLYVPILHKVTERFLTPYYMGLLLLGAIINFMIGATALFLRAFKRDPFVWVSLIGACLNVALALWFGKLYGASGVVYSYLLLNLLFGLPTAWWIWRNNTSHLTEARLGLELQ